MKPNRGAAQRAEAIAFFRAVARDPQVREALRRIGWLGNDMQSNRQTILVGDVKVPWRETRRVLRVHRDPDAPGGDD